MKSSLMRFGCGLALLFVNSVLWAGEVSLEQAKTAARRWIGRDSAKMTASFGAGNIHFAYTASNAVGRSLFHVVGLENGGYIVLSGDTRVPPVVAFSESGTLDVSDTNNPLCAMLERDMGNRIKAIEDDIAAIPAIKAAGSKNANSSEEEWAELLAENLALDAKASYSNLPDIRVAPLVQSKWDQAEWNGYRTFNLYTPNYYVCGCVATAFAQIMR